MTDPRTDSTPHPHATAPEPLRERLRRLPAPPPGDDFTAGVLARIVAEERTAGRRPRPAAAGRLRVWALPLAAAVLALMVAVEQEGPWSFPFVGPVAVGPGGEVPAGGAGAAATPERRTVGVAGERGPAAAASPSPGGEGAIDDATGGTGGEAAGSGGGDRLVLTPGRSVAPTPRPGTTASGDGSVRRAPASPPADAATRGPSRGSADRSPRSRAGRGPSAAAASGSRRTAPVPGGAPGRSADRPQAPLATTADAARDVPAFAELAPQAAVRRLAELRSERRRLAAELASLRAAVPAEPATALWLGGDESFQLVLDLTPSRAETGGDPRPAGLASPPPDLY